MEGISFLGPDKEPCSHLRFDFGAGGHPKAFQEGTALNELLALWTRLLFHNLPHYELAYEDDRNRESTTKINSG